MGQLVDTQSGKPLANVAVMYAVSDRAKGSPHYIEWHDWNAYVDGYGPFGTVQRATTDEIGTFWFSESTDEPEGTLFVFAPGYERLILPPEQLPYKDEAGRMRITIQPEAALSGVLLSGGKPLADAQFSVWRTKPDDRYRRDLRASLHRFARPFPHRPARPGNVPTSPLDIAVAQRLHAAIARSR